MAYEFFVVMQKRSDGKVYADLHKTDERMYLIEEEADAAIDGMGDLANNFHKVKMVGVLADELYDEQRNREMLAAYIDQCYRMLLSEPDTKGALFKAENILREALGRNHRKR